MRKKFIKYKPIIGPWRTISYMRARAIMLREHKDKPHIPLDWLNARLQGATIQEFLAEQNPYASNVFETNEPANPSKNPLKHLAQAKASIARSDTA